MALQMRQTSFITKLSLFVNKMEALWYEGMCLEKCFDEEFDTEKDNALDEVTQDIENSYGFSATNIEDAITAIKQFRNYYEGNAVITNEYGKDIRRIK
jgi:hypothetical protein